MTFLVAVTNYLSEAAYEREKVCFTSQCQLGHATEASYIGGTSKQTQARPGAGYDLQWLDPSG